MVKTTVEGKEAAWKEVVGARYDVVKERYVEVFKEEKGRVKRCKY